jgi:preprotein translocase subunit SecA
MFGSMMKAIAQDFVRYVMHVQVVRPDQQPAPGQPAVAAAAAPAPAAPAVSNVRELSSDTAQLSGFQSAAAATPVAELETVDTEAPRPARAASAPAPQTARRQQVPKQETVVKDEWSKTPRNAPCPCGSGKKFKLCHGKS